MSSRNENTTNTTYFIVGDYSAIQTVMTAFKYNEILVVIVGTLLNLWFLLAILTSRDMRSRLRNKIICNIAVVNLLDSAIIIPASIAVKTINTYFGCAFYSVFNNLHLMQDFIVNWLMVMILVVFIAQIQDFNPGMMITPRAVTLGTLGLLVLPWVASLVVVPIIVHQYKVTDSWTTEDCLIPTWDSYQTLKSVDTAVPIILAVLLVIVAAALRYRRFTRGYSSGSMRVELINRGPEIDNTFAYVTAVLLFIVCDLLRMVINLDWITFEKYGYVKLMLLYVSSYLVSDSRVVLMLLPWLLLPDVRQRIKTWRPWYHPAPGIDLTVTYTKEEN